MKRLAGLLLGLLALASPLLQADEKQHPEVVLETSAGPLVLRLYAQAAPQTVQQFLHLVDSGFYNGSVFHRSIPRFILQGGGFDAELRPKTADTTVANESRNRLSNREWTVAMARTADPDSASSQFFINLANNSELDFRYARPGYTVFGELIEGHAHVLAMSAIPRLPRQGMADVPETLPVIHRAYRRNPPDDRTQR